MKKIKKDGRPAKKLGDKRTYMFSFKMNPREHISLKSKAKEAGVSRSKYLRQCIAGSIVKERLTPELNNYIRQLSGMGNNLNQIARKANIEGYSHIRSEYLDIAEKIDHVIDLIEDDGKDSKGKSL